MQLSCLCCLYIYYLYMYFYFVKMSYVVCEFIVNEHFSNDLFRLIYVNWMISWDQYFMFIVFSIQQSI